MTGLDLVVFDMAGTTVQATDHVPAALREAFALVGATLSDDEIRAVRGRSKREAIAALLRSHAGGARNEDDAERVFDEFQRLLIERYSHAGVDPIDGAAEIFAWLRARGVKVALSTGFESEIVDLLLAQLDWRDAVDVVVCNADVPRGRPAPYLVYRAMERTGSDCVRRVAVLGDTTADLQAGFNAGVRWNIGVLSGAHDRARLEACPHDAIIASVKDLPGVLGHMSCGSR